MFFSRREFLKTGASVIAVGAGVPAMVMNLAHARAADNAKSGKERILVIFELNGGNDGLNTLIPVKDPQYKVLRPTLAIPEATALALDDGKVALHPSMTGFHDLYKAKQLAVVQGAGYPNPDRSHFRSMEIWHRGDPRNNVTTGWLGRYYEHALGKTCESPVPIVHYGQQRPEVFKSHKAPSISVNAIDDFYPLNQKPESVAISTLYKNLKGEGGNTDGEEMEKEEMERPEVAPDEVIQNTGQDIVRGTEIIKKVLQNPRTPKIEYPEGPVGAGLAVFAQMIVQDTGTRLFYINMGGFDTHARQATGHADLLATVSSTISAFVADLKAENRDKDVLVMAFSEFGRTVKENGSMGTDHGTASVMFFAGGGLKPGLHGAYPSLTDLQDGEMKHTTDFRDCYATVLEDWFGAAADRVLPGHKGRIGIL